MRRIHFRHFLSKPLAFLCWFSCNVLTPHALQPVSVRYAAWYFRPPAEQYNIQVILITCLVEASLALVLFLLLFQGFSIRLQRMSYLLCLISSAFLLLHYFSTNMVLGVISVVVFSLSVCICYLTIRKKGGSHEAP